MKNVIVKSPQIHITWDASANIKSKEMSVRPVLSMALHCAFKGDKEKIRQYWIKTFDKGLRKYNNKY